MKSILVFFTIAAAMLGSAANASEFYGLLRERDLTPFGFLRLDMRPAHAVSIEPGNWVLEAELGYQNTWSLSPNVQDYLTSLESQGRRILGPNEVAAIRNLPGESYLIDLELATLDLTLHYKFSEQWAAYITLSAVSYQGGFLDSFIEHFHHSTGFDTFGRPALKQNDLNAIYNLKTVHLTSIDLPDQRGFTDPTIGVRYAGFELADRAMRTTLAQGSLRDAIEFDTGTALGYSSYNLGRYDDALAHLISLKQQVFDLAVRAGTDDLTGWSGLLPAVVVVLIIGLLGAGLWPRLAEYRR